MKKKTLTLKATTIGNCGDCGKFGRRFFVYYHGFYGGIPRCQTCAELEIKP